MQVSNVNDSLAFYLNSEDLKKFKELNLDVGSGISMGFTSVKNQVALYASKEANVHIRQQKNSRIHPYTFAFWKSGFNKAFNHVTCSYEIKSNGIIVNIPEEATIRYTRNKIKTVLAHLNEQKVTLDEFSNSVKTVNKFLAQNPKLVTLDIENGNFLRYLISNA